MAPKRPRMKEHRISAVGAAGAGRRCLISQYICGYFPEDYSGCNCTLMEDSYRKQDSVDGEPCLVEILDIRCPEGYQAMYEVYIQDSEGVMLVYSIKDRKSFEAIRTEREKALTVKRAKGMGEDVPMLIVGNKADDITERAVAVKEGEDLAKELGYPFIEVSAKEGTNVDHAFAEILRAVHQHKKNKEEQEKAQADEKEKESKKSFGCWRGKNCVVM